MENLNLPQPPLKTKSIEGKLYVFDPVRKKDVLATSEEWVRQHFVWYLMGHLKYPKGMIKIESGHSVNKLAKRTDILVYGPDMLPRLLVECKAPTVPLNQSVLDQAVIYNRTIQSDYIVITNGMRHLCFARDTDAGTYKTHHFIPPYSEVSS